MVVELAVVDQHGAPVRRDHGLVARLRQVDDAEPGVTELQHRRRALPGSSIVRSAMLEPIEGRFDRQRGGRTQPTSRDSAHQPWPRAPFMTQHHTAAAPGVASDT
jgi:hypothetical protein